jgi:GT2 family glycosyltransferase
VHQFVSIIVITYRRARSVHDCLAHLTAQAEPADQIVVVDASEDHATADVVAGFTGVTYLRNTDGVGNMTSSRNAGLRVATGEIIAFLDDDAYAEPAYVQSLRRAYRDPTIGLACSRTLNGQQGESASAPGGVGTFLDDGTLIGNFAFDPGPGRLLEIDHGIGATMSFRRSTLEAMGGFREDYRGVSGVREDSDAFLRARRLGFRAVFVSDAVARHVAAPQAKGRRFDLRYGYCANRNHVLLIINNFGVCSGLLWRWTATELRAALGDHRRTPLRRLVWFTVRVSGIARGLSLALARQRGRVLPARLEGAKAAELRSWLSRPAA